MYYTIFKLFEEMAMRVVIQVLKPENKRNPCCATLLSPLSKVTDPSRVIPEIFSEFDLTLNIRYLTCIPLHKVTIKAYSGNLSRDRLNPQCKVPYFLSL
jgi:hypothetical protein